MTTDANSLRTRLGKLYVDRTVGDVTERVFQREVAERTVDLYREIIRKKLAEGEELEAEHHTISSHFRVTQSLLKEPDQHAVSLFLTNRRLLRLRSIVFPGQPPTADSRDSTTVDAVKLETIEGLRGRRQIRLGEAGVGVVLCAIAVLFYELLSFTGPVLVVLGTLGILHAVLLPTRWIEVKMAGSAGDDDPIVIPTASKKSARKLMRMLRERAGKNVPR